MSVKPIILIIAYSLCTRSQHTCKTCSTSRMCFSLSSEIKAELELRYIFIPISHVLKSGKAPFKLNPYQYKTFIYNIRNAICTHKHPNCSTCSSSVWCYNSANKIAARIQNGYEITFTDLKITRKDLSNHA